MLTLPPTIWAVPGPDSVLTSVTVSVVPGFRSANSLMTLTGTVSPANPTAVISKVEGGTGESGVALSTILIENVP